MSQSLNWIQLCRIIGRVVAKENPTKVLALSPNATLIKQMLTELKQRYQDKALALLKEKHLTLKYQHNFDHHFYYR